MIRAITTFDLGGAAGRAALLCYSHLVRKEDVIAFAGRDWEAIAALKRRRWAEQKAHMTPAEALAVGDELRRHAVALRPDWPTEDDRRNDIAVHARVSESLRRVNTGRRR